MCPNGGTVRTKNRRRGPRSRHWKEPVCAEQGEALVTFAALSVQGDFFLPRNFFSALSCKVEFGMCVDPSPRSNGGQVQKLPMAWVQKQTAGR